MRLQLVERRSITDFAPKPVAAADPIATGTMPPGRRGSGYVMRPDIIDLALSLIAVMALAFVPIFGTVPVGIFLLAFIALFALQPARSGVDLLRFLPLLSLPILAMCSTLWSDAPERTLRAAIQLFITISAAITLSRRIDGRQLILLAFIACCTTCLMAVPYIPSLHGQPLYGPFGSKNYLAIFAVSLMALSQAIVFDRLQPAFARFLAIPAIPFAIFLISLAQSAGAITSSILFTAIFLPMVLFGRFSMTVRSAMLVVLLILVVFALILLPDLQSAWVEFRVGVLKKDATLTGRTYLWNFAARLIDEAPIFGHGYYAFWRQGNIDAEGLWRYFGIANRTGFNFHSAFTELMVDLGWVGAGVMAVTGIGVAATAIMRMLVRPTVMLAFFLAFMVMLFVRAYAETGLVAPFDLIMVLWISTGVYAARPVDEASGSQRRRGGAASIDRRIGRSLSDTDNGRVPDLAAVAKEARLR